MNNMNMDEYNQKVREAVARDKAVNAAQDVSNLGRHTTRTVATPSCKKIVLYGR